MTVNEILALFGVTGDIAKAVGFALADPTSANVNAVVKAYAANGQVVPGKLYAYLLKINEERYPEDTVRAAAFPYLFVGGAVLAFVLFGTRKKQTRKRR